MLINIVHVWPLVAQARISAQLNLPMCVALFPTAKILDKVDNAPPRDAGGLGPRLPRPSGPLRAGRGRHHVCRVCRAQIHSWWDPLVCRQLVRRVWRGVSVCLHSSPTVHPRLPAAAKYAGLSCSERDRLLRTADVSKSYDWMGKLQARRCLLCVTTSHTVGLGMIDVTTSGRRLRRGGRSDLRERASSPRSSWRRPTKASTWPPSGWARASDPTATRAPWRARTRWHSSTRRGRGGDRCSSSRRR